MRVTQLLQLCPEHSEDRAGLQAVGLYYKILNFVQHRFAQTFPSLQDWTERELAGCTNFAAVVLDRRIALSRAILMQEGEI